MSNLILSPTNPSLPLGSAQINQALNQITAGVNEHNHDPGSSSGYGHSIPAWGLTNSLYSLHGPGGGGVGNDWATAYDGQAAIPADPSESASDPANTTLSVNWGIAGELQRIRGFLGKVFAGGVTGDWQHFSGSIPVLSGGDMSIAGVMTATRFVSTVAAGTPPFSATSTTTAPNLSADMVDGHHADVLYGDAADAGNLLALDGDGLLPLDSIEYDAAEASTFDTIAAGTSTLVNSMNRMRFAIAEVKQAAGGPGLDWDSTLGTIVTSIAGPGGPPLGGDWVIDGGVGINVSQSGTNPSTLLITLNGTMPANTGALNFGDFFPDTLVSGLGETASGLDVTIATGVGYVNGTRSTLSTPSTKTMPVSSDNYIDWTGADDPVAGIVVVSVANGAAEPTIPMGHVRLWEIVTGASSITSVIDRRPTGLHSSSFLTNPMTTVNDMIVAGSAGVPSRLAAGADNTWLKSVAGVPTWTTLPASASTPTATTTTAGKVKVDNNAAGNPVAITTVGYLTSITGLVDANISGVSASKINAGILAAARMADTTGITNPAVLTYTPSSGLTSWLPASGGGGGVGTATTTAAGILKVDNNAAGNPVAITTAGFHSSITGLGDTNISGLSASKINAGTMTPARLASVTGVSAISMLQYDPSSGLTSWTPVGSSGGVGVATTATLGTVKVDNNASGNPIAITTAGYLSSITSLSDNNIASLSASKLTHTAGTAKPDALASITSAVAGWLLTYVNATSMVWSRVPSNRVGTLSITGDGTTNSYTFNFGTAFPAGTAPTTFIEGVQATGNFGPEVINTTTASFTIRFSAGPIPSGTTIQVKYFATDASP